MADATMSPLATTRLDLSARMSVLQFEVRTSKFEVRAAGRIIGVPPERYGPITFDTPGSVGEYRRALSIHTIGILGLVAVFVVGTLRPVNLGALALVATYLVGTFAARE